MRAQSRPTLCNPWNVACQVPLSMEFSRQEYWSGWPFPPPGNLPDPRIEPKSPAPPALAGGFFTTEPSGKPLCLCLRGQILQIVVLIRSSLGFLSIHSDVL